VAIGLCFAARLARRLGRIDDKRVAEHERLVASYGLPTHLPDGADPDELMTIMSRDKKGALTFVLDGTGGLEVVPGIDPAVVREAL
jgi:5-deoxy-5-amino-3-dehydroquinate synthase